MLALVILAQSPLVARAPRAAQRLLADRAEAEARERLAGGPGTRVSRSHSRGVSGALAGDASVRLGLDIEFAGAARRWREIIASFADVVPPGADAVACCRAWTFIEAWYKAFGERPAPALVSACAAADLVLDRSIRIDRHGVAAWRRHLGLGGGFEACLVWTGAEVELDLFVPDLSAPGLN
jgi:hypothetical protein